MDRVLLGLSGGIDSSCAALELQKQGYSIIAIFMRLFKEENGEITKLENQARSVADHLGIEFQTMGLQRDFKEQVIDYFIKEYVSGNTPNPCVVCNRMIKFGKLWDIAQSLGCHKIATGHYARIITEEKQNKGQYFIAKAKDRIKDQSYFLFDINKKRLPDILFPLSDITKAEAIQKVKQHSIPVDTTKESNELCFVSSDNYRDLLKQEVPHYFKPGLIVNTKGEPLGEHQGFLNYTIGQRRGLGIGYSEPLYVLRINKESNEVVVGTKKEVYSQQFNVHSMNLFMEDCFNGKSIIQVKVRYQARSIPCTAMHQGNYLSVQLKEPYLAITPGQAAVFYKGDKVVGGGWIQ